MVSFQENHYTSTFKNSKVSEITRGVFKYSLAYTSILVHQLGIVYNPFFIATLYVLYFPMVNNRR